MGISSGKWGVGIARNLNCGARFEDYTDDVPVLSGGVLAVARETWFSFGELDPQSAPSIASGFRRSVPMDGIGRYVANTCRAVVEDQHCAALHSQSLSEKI